VGPYETEADARAEPLAWRLEPETVQVVIGVITRANTNGRN
jgi:hypothetical protein